MAFTASDPRPPPHTTYAFAVWKPCRKCSALTIALGNSGDFTRSTASLLNDTVHPNRHVRVRHLDMGASFTFIMKSTKPWSSSLDTGVYALITRTPSMLAKRWT